MKKERKYTLLLLSIVIFTSGCSTKNKANESSIESNTYTSITNAETTNAATIKSSAAAEVTDPNGISLYRSGDKTDLPLYAALPLDNIYLYGNKPSGMVLYQDGKYISFNWTGLVSKRLPEMSYLDYNNDGKKELAVTLYVDSGTGVSLTDLHILNMISANARYEYTDNTLSAQDVKKWFNKSIVAEPASDKKTITVNFNDQNYIVKFPTDNLSLGTFNGVSYGDVVGFKFSGNKIIVDIAIGFTFTKMAITTYFATVEATVNFDNNEFTLGDYTFTIDNQYK